MITIRMRGHKVPTLGQSTLKKFQPSDNPSQKSSKPWTIAEKSPNEIYSL